MDLPTLFHRLPLIYRLLLIAVVAGLGGFVLVSASPGVSIDDAVLASGPHFRALRGPVAVASPVVGLGSNPSEQESQPEEALLGFDPILLIRGEEELGDEDLALVHEGYRYLFVSAENREAFRSDPARWGIQLGGLCARMGGTTGGDAGRWLVHEGRIYVFGTETCRQRFEAAPERYLEPEPAPPLRATAGEMALRRGAELVDRAVESLGGAAALDGLSSWIIEAEQVLTRSSGSETVPLRMIWAAPDRFRQERTFPGFGTIADIVTGETAFIVTPRESRRMTAAAAANLRRSFRRSLLPLLRARRQAAFTATAVGGDRADGRQVERVGIEAGGVRAVLAVDAASGRPVSLSYVDRGPEGEWGTLTEHYDDYRETGGLELPFRTTVMFEGTRLVERTSFTAGAIRLDVPVDAALFAPGS